MSLWIDFVVAAAVWLMIRVRQLYLGNAICLQCGGRGAHRPDCPLA